MKKLKKNRNGYRFCWLLLGIPAALFLQMLARLSPTTTEALYSRGIYSVLSAAGSAFWGLFPFSAAEILLAAIVFWALFILLRGFIHIFTRGPRELIRALLKIGAFLSAAFFLFTVLWGLNYYRVPLAATLELKDAEPTAQELSEETNREVGAVNSLCGQIRFGAGGSSVYDGSFQSMCTEVNSGYGQMEASLKPVDRYYALWQAYPKSCYPENILSYASIQGIFIPFTFEPTVDSGYPSFILPFALSHETAHFKGYAREDEANFLAYLACLNSQDLYYRYSGHMNAILYLSDALYQTDPSLCKQDLQKLDARAKADFSSYDKYLSLHQSGFEKTATKINDSYLKSQGQSGIVSYDHFVTLLCDWYRTHPESALS